MTTDPWHDRGVIEPARIALQLLTDLAGLVALSHRPRRSVVADYLVLGRELALYRLARSCHPFRGKSTQPRTVSPEAGQTQTMPIKTILLTFLTTGY